MIHMTKSMRGTLWLLLAALIWGMAFAAQSSAADVIGGFTFNATRSGIACAFLGGILLIRGFTRRQKACAASPDIKGKSPLLAGVLCGIALFVAANFQQFGIAAYPAGTAAAGRAGFLTATYVIMIALFSWITGRKLRLTVLLATVICMAGMYLLCLSDGWSSIYLGDVLELAGAATFSVHILVVDHFSDRDSLTLSTVQFLVCGLLSFIAMLLFEKPDLSALMSAWLPIGYAGVFSSGIGYTLQMVGQKDAEPTVASIAMSLESVFAALAGWVILNERLSGKELFGCALVFAAVILAQIPRHKATEPR